MTEKSTQSSMFREIPSLIYYLTLMYNHGMQRIGILTASDDELEPFLETIDTVE